MFLDTALFSEDENAPFVKPFLYILSTCFMADYWEMVLKEICFTAWEWKRYSVIS